MKTVKVNDHGRRIGDSHPRAKLTDHEVDLIRDLAEEGMKYRDIASKFDVSYETVKSYVQCRLRAQTVARVKRVKG